MIRSLHHSYSMNDLSSSTLANSPVAGSKRTMSMTRRKGANSASPATSRNRTGMTTRINGNQSLQKENEKDGSKKSKSATATEGTSTIKDIYSIYGTLPR